MLNIFLMFEVFLVSSWDISHSQFGIQNQILVSRGYRDTANFRPCKGKAIFSYNKLLNIVENDDVLVLSQT